jgi:hypothetical protein
MPETMAEADLLKQAHFVFNGAIGALKASTIAAVAAVERTAIVRVGQILQAPEALSRFGGKDITVLLAGDAPVATGDEFTFFTNEWLYGESVAVRSLAQLPIAETAASFAPVDSDPVETLARRRLSAHVEDADLVISGKVTSVALPADAGATADRPPGLLAPREHDPHWRDAQVEVQTVHKGAYAAKSVTVRFPSSHDRMWFHAPKLTPGAEGQFILHKSTATGGRAPGVAEAEAAPGVEDGSYAVLHPEDFQSIAEPGGLRQLLNIPD